MRTPRHSALLLLGALCALAGPGRAADPEDELKAAAVFAFLQNSQWADRAPAGAPVVVGFRGRPAFIELLRRSLEGKSANGRPVRVIELKSAGEGHGCQAIYLALDKKAELKQALASGAAARALTIGESDRFLEYGGAVNLFVTDGHMAFEVSLAALERSGTVISSKLLRFGQIRENGRGDAGK